MERRWKVVKVSLKGSIVIPKVMREHKGMKVGSRVLVEEEEWGLRVTVVPEDPVAAARGLLKGGSSLVEALLQERAQEKEHEERLIKRFRRRSE